MCAITRRWCRENSCLQHYRLQAWLLQLSFRWHVCIKLQVAAEGSEHTIARVVLRRGKFEHITPALIDLHWLPVKCVAYKLATLTYSIKRSGQPLYVHELLQDYQPTYSLSSVSHDLLATTRPRSVASRACKHSAATTIATFKRKLKTFLFNQVFAI